MKYKYIGTEEQLIKNGFTYRKHYDNYILLYSENNAITGQDLFVEIDVTTKQVDIDLQMLNNHRDKGKKYPQFDIYPEYIKLIQDLIDKGLVEVIGE